MATAVTETAATKVQDKMDIFYIQYLAKNSYHHNRYSATKCSLQCNSCSLNGLNIYLKTTNIFTVHLYKSGQHSNFIKFAFEYFFFHGSTALVGLVLLIIEASRSHSDTPHSVGLLWTSDLTVAEMSSWKKKHNRQTCMLTARFEPAIPASERPLTPRLRPHGHWDRHSDN
jgi:hypothetical protein